MTVLIALLMPLFSFSQDATTSATLYDLKSNQAKKLYTLDVQLSAQDDGIHSKATYKDIDGKEVVREDGVVKGAQVLRYEINQGQTQEKGRFVVDGDLIRFEYEGKGKKKNAEEKIKGPLLSTANFNAFVRENWDKLNTGKGMDVRFAVWDRLETVGFTLQKMGEVEKGGDKWMELRMKPTSFIIAALVDPIFLWYAQSDKKLMLMKGRVAPKQLKDGKWKDLDAEAVYTYDQKAVSK
nr:hypothetical protein [uncultured Bdellovibrio sp.]